MFLDGMFQPHHVSLSVRDMQRSVAFYRTFGFNVLYQYASANNDKRITHLGLAALILEHFELTPDGSESRESNRSIQPIGIRHFALQTKSIETAHRSVLSLGIQCEQIAVGLSSMKYFFVCDPDGIWFEIVEDTRQPSSR